MPAQTPPATIATTMITEDVQRTAGSQACPPTTAAAKAAMRYWPSTPMLNRFIRKPMATARPRGSTTWPS